MSLSNTVDSLIKEQCESWQQAHDNYEALAGVKVKQFSISNCNITVQFNPSRIVSTAAKVDKKSIGERKCFLCEANRPAVQRGVNWTNAEKSYTILINPFPIFKRHLTIPCNNHEPQRITDRLNDMVMLAQELPDFTLFYNGARCGASAPDHMHFQAGNRGFMNIESDSATWHKSALLSLESASLSQVDSPLYSYFEVLGNNANDIALLGAKAISALPIIEGDTEPMLNVLCYFANAQWHLIIVPRRKHRPDCYFADDDSKLLISPASVDMGGVLITPIEADFEKITSNDICQIFAEVCYNKEQLLEISKTLCNS